MVEENRARKIHISGSTLTFEKVYSKKYFPKEHEKELKKANVLLLPIEGFRELVNPVFPEETLAFYRYLQEKEQNDLVIDICIADEDYQEFELHSDLIELPLLILEGIMFPVVVEIINEYLKEKKKVTKKEHDIKVELIVTEKDRSKSIKYEGPANEFQKVTKEIKDDFGDS